MLGKRISYLLGGFAGLIAVTGILVGSVSYEPEGIPRPLLPKYKSKIQQVKRDAEYAQRMGQQIRPIAHPLETRFEFGMLDPHTTASHTFYFENRGQAPLTLSVLGTTCKCTVGEASDGEILPGGGGKVTLTWNTGYKAERYEQTARVATNDPLLKTVELSVSGEVKADLVVPEQCGFGDLDPNEIGTAHIILYSQLWDELTVEDVTSELPAFSWEVEPVAADQVGLEDEQVRSIWKISITTTGTRRGAFSAPLQVSVRCGGGELIERVVVAGGKVRAPINFYSPDIHRETGLSFGVLHNDQEHRFPVVVRTRGVGQHELKVLGVKPDELRAEIEPLANREGEFRLTVIVDKDCPQVTFNRDRQHGYVEVGDPQDPEYKNWFPLYGAVVPASVQH